MTSSADHAQTMRDRHLRELRRLMVHDPRSPEVRRKVAESVAKLSREDEDDALAWIESVSEFDEPPTDSPASARDTTRK